MTRHNLSRDKFNLFVPLSILFLLFTGIVISVIQVQHQQDQRSRASTALPPNDCTVDANQLTINANEQAMFDQINAYRQQNGLSALVWSNELKKAATWLTKDNLVYNKLSTSDSLGRGTSQRVLDCGWVSGLKVEENIDAKSSNPTPVLAHWKSSPEQNNNLLNPIFKKVGIAQISRTTGSGAFWTVTLGAETSLTPTQGVTPSIGLTPVISLPKANNTPLPTKKFTPTGVIIPSPTPDPRFVANPNDTQIRVAVKFSGIGLGGNQLPQHSSRKVTVTVFNDENEKVLSGSGFVKYDNNDLFTGIIHLGKLDNGFYYLKVVSDNTLQAIVLPPSQNLSNTRLNILSPVILLQGEFTKDNKLTVEDFNVALACFQNKRCAVQAYPDQDNQENVYIYNTLDLNDDGKVDIYDYNTLLRNYQNQVGD